VPEIAARRHLENILPVIQGALDQAQITLADLDGLAVTQRPGLIGALIIGMAAAKTLSYTLGKPLVGVHHLQAHIMAAFLLETVPAFPFVALVVSGGHTNLYRVNGFTDMTLLGRSRDDAAGEAFDKVAKIMSLGYPGGPVIDRLAHDGDPGRIRFPRPCIDTQNFDFSFSGVKTAVGRYIAQHRGDDRGNVADIAAGFQEAVVDVLVLKLMRAAREKGCARIALAGGVAANSRLRERTRQDAAAAGYEAYLPSLPLCGDNAAMVAAAGYHLLASGRRSEPEEDVFSRHP
jgi:N6-L-threonylcarbamoyladenine synthase